MARKQSKSHQARVWKLYQGGKPKNKFCPKCGKGYFMAAHKDRQTCGKCGYTEFVRK